MSDLLECPHCNCSLIHSEIPKHQRCNDSCNRTSVLKDRDYESECWKNHVYGNNKFFLKTVGMEVSEIYDGILYWFCPECNGTWHRWPKDSAMYRIAQEYLDSEGHKP